MNKHFIHNIITLFRFLIISLKYKFNSNYKYIKKMRRCNDKFTDLYFCTDKNNINKNSFIFVHVDIRFKKSLIKTVKVDLDPLYKIFKEIDNQYNFFIDSNNTTMKKRIEYNDLINKINIDVIFNFIKRNTNYNIVESDIMLYEIKEVTKTKEDQLEATIGKLFIHQSIISELLLEIIEEVENINQDIEDKKRQSKERLLKYLDNPF